MSSSAMASRQRQSARPPPPGRSSSARTWRCWTTHVLHRLFRQFIRTHLEVLVATDFFTAEVWTLGGLVTYYVLFFMHLGSRQVHMAGVTPHPDTRWMLQMARNV